MPKNKNSFHEYTEDGVYPEKEEIYPEKEKVIQENDEFILKKTSKTCSYCNIDILPKKEPFWQRKAVLIILISGILFSIGIYLERSQNMDLFAELFFLAVVVVAGFGIIRRAFYGLLKFSFNIDLLMTIAAAGAFLIGHGEEGAAVMFLFYVAEFLEDYASDRAISSMASLLKLAPETAHVIRNNQELEVHVHSVKIDEKAVVRQGDKIPLDGIIVKGSSTIDQSSITGESIPVTKKIGDEVFAGTINIEGYLELMVTKESGDTVLSRIIGMVRDSKNSNSKTEAFIDVFATYYTPLVILMAILVAVVPPTLMGMSLDEWFYRALVLLVVSCPCALAISTPVSMVSSITSATRNGVLIKGGEYVEGMKNVKVMVFDKTGTLTEGCMEVTDVLEMNGHFKKEILGVSASLESHSKHPLAKAILKIAENEKIHLYEVHNFKSIVGSGLEGEINNLKFRVGGEGMFNDLELPRDKIKEFEEDGKTSVLVGNKKEIMGLIVFRDHIRDDAIKTVKFLKSEDIKTVMLTGDNKGPARALACELGLDEYYHSLLPADKVKMIEKLVYNHENVAMLGDGVNDAPALAKANIGMAMGAAGSDVAIETGDIALMHDDLSKLEYLFKLSKKTITIVQENVTISIAVKSSFAISAVLGFVTLWMAVGIADMGLSLMVILNALRIGRIKSHDNIIVK